MSVFDGPDPYPLAQLQSFSTLFGGITLVVPIDLYSVLCSSVQPCCWVFPNFHQSSNPHVVELLSTTVRTGVGVIRSSEKSFCEPACFNILLLYVGKIQSLSFLSAQCMGAHSLAAVFMERLLPPFLLGAGCSVCMSNTVTKSTYPYLGRACNLYGRRHHSN